MLNRKLDIIDYYGKMTKSQKRIADYFIKYREEARGSTIDEISDRIGVSKASVVRFAKTLEFSGYREFIMWFASVPYSDDTVQEGPLPDYMDVSPGDPIEKIVRHIFRMGKQSIDQTIAVCNEDMISAAVAKIHMAKRIDFFGMGAGSIIAYDAQQKFLRINKVSYAFEDFHVQATSASTLSPEDVLVVISYSGETAEPIKIAQIAKKAGAYVIAITKYGKSTLSDTANLNLHVSTPESSIRSAATGSRLSQLCIIDILYSAVLSLEFQEAKPYLEATRTAVDNRNWRGKK